LGLLTGLLIRYRIGHNSTAPEVHYYAGEQSLYGLRHQGTEVAGQVYGDAERYDHEYRGVRGLLYVIQGYVEYGVAVNGYDERRRSIYGFATVEVVIRPR